MNIKQNPELINNHATAALVKYSRLPFHPIRMLINGGHARHLVIMWLMICAITIPLSILTRTMEWTGIPLDVAGITVHLSIYLPLIVCIPLVMYMGFLWGAIPAYFSTFVVALYGELPLQWIVVFSFANPLGLAMYSLFYRVTSLSIVIKDLSSILGFVLVSLLSAFTGSVGSFVWAHTYNQGISDTYPVWQGWWLGGWLQASLIVGPLLFLFGERILKFIDAPQSKKVPLEVWRKKFFLALILGLMVLIGYVAVARFFGITEANLVIQEIHNEDLKRALLNAIDSLTYPMFVLLGAVIVCCYFVYRAIQFWTTELIKANHHLAASNEQLEKLALTDTLTNIANRRSIMATLENVFMRSLREKSPLCIIMVDADNFKLVNDRYGHLAGDLVLQQLVLRMQKQLRKYEHIGRFGGEEFIIVLPNSDLNESLNIAERTRRSIEASPIETPYGPIKVTISLGLAQLSELDNTHTVFINRADKALIESKQQGRNRITVAKA
ncbi:GGDEF domain-containing protein [Paraglaciecola aestuariivivens]